MAIKRDPSTGQFLSATADREGSSIEQIMAESDARKAALDADAGKTPEQIEAAAQAAEEAKVKEREAQEAAAAGKDTEASDFLGDFVSDTSRTARPDKKAEAEKKRVAAEKAAADKKKQADEAATVVRRHQPRELSAEQIAAAAAEGVARAMKPAAPEKKDPETPVNPHADMPPEDQRKMVVLGHMEKLFPERYKGIGDKYKAGQKKLNDYASKWEKDHPGEEFDEAAEEHASFLAEHNVDWLEEDYIDAIADMRAEAKHSSAQKDSTDKMSALELKVNRQEKMGKATPAVVGEQCFARKKLYGIFGKDADILNEHGFPDRDKVAASSTKDPIGTSYRLAAAQDLDHEVSAIFLLMPPDEFKIGGRGLVDFDKNDPVHVAMAAFCDEVEADLASKPIEERTNGDGKVFVSAEAWHKLPKEQRAKHWTLTAHDIAYLRARRIAKETDAMIAAEKKKFADYAKASGYTPPSDAENEPGEDDEEQTAGGTEKPHSPSLGGESRLAAAKNKAGAGAASGGKSFWDTF